MAPINFSRKRHGGNHSTELDITTRLSTGEVDIDIKEVYFLIMHFLSSGPCQRTYAQFCNELLEHELLPRRYHAWYSRTGVRSGNENDNGLSLPLSYSNLVDRYSHVERDHLIKLLKQLVLYCSPPLNGLGGGYLPNAADVPTLLGSGSFSLLGLPKDQELKHLRYPPLYLRWPHTYADQVRGLSLREIGGGFRKHHRAPSIHAACHAIVKPSTVVQKMEVIKKLRGHQNAVYCAIFDRSGCYIITGSDDRLVKIWSLETAFCLSSCRGHEGDITDLAVSSSNSLVASASNDFVIRVWRLPDGLPISVLRGHTGAVTAIAFSPRPGCSYHLLSSSDDGTCRIWDSRSSMCSPRIYIPKPPEIGAGKTTNPIPNSTPPVYQILCCAFNSNGTVFVTGSSDTYARVFIACKHINEEPEQPNHEIDLLSGHENDVNYVQFSGCAVSSKFSVSEPSKEDNLPRFKNSWFNLDNIVTCSRDGSAIIWIPRSRRSHGKAGRWIRAYHLKVPPPPPPLQPARGGPRQRSQPTPRGVNMIVWSLDNHFVLAAIMDCRICVWNVSDGSLVHCLIGHSESTFVLDVHPSDPRMAMSAGYDGKVIIWDIWEGAPVRIYETGRFKLVDGRFSQDGTSVVVSDEVGQIYIIGTGQGESQKDAKYDQFFLGDYRPLIRDAQGNVLDQETQLLPYRRNIQDLLCDSSMIPYPEPYQNKYQQRRLGTLGIEWRPPSVKFAVGPSTTAGGEYQMLPLPDLDRWVEPLPEFLDAMDWEPENEVQSDDTDSEYNVAEEYSTEEDQGSIGISSKDSECSAEDSEACKEDQEGVRRSKRKKMKPEVEFTTSGRRVKRRNLDGNDDAVTNSEKKKTKKKGKTASRKKTSKSKTHRPRRRAAQNALTFFSQIGDASTAGEDDDDSETYSTDDSAIPDSNTQSHESGKSFSNYQINHMLGKEINRVEVADSAKPITNFDSQPATGIKRRLVLKLPVRDIKKHASEQSRNGITECNDIAASSGDKCPDRNLNNSWDPGQASEDRVMLTVHDEVGTSATEKPVNQPGTSAVHQDAKIRWGEVKIRTSKRMKVNDSLVGDVLLHDPSPSLENNDEFTDNAGGYLECKNEHQVLSVSPHSHNHASENHSCMEDYQDLFAGCASVSMQKIVSHEPSFSYMRNSRGPSQKISRGLNHLNQLIPASNEENTSVISNGGNRMSCPEAAENKIEGFPETESYEGGHEQERAHTQNDSRPGQDAKHISSQLVDAEDSNQPVHRRLKFTSKKVVGESNASCSRLTTMEHQYSRDLAPDSDSYAERDLLSVVNEDDLGSSGDSDCDWTAGSTGFEHDTLPKYNGKCLKISRTVGFSELEPSTVYGNAETSNFRRTRSASSRTIDNESNSLLRSCRVRESYDYAEASKSGFRSLRNESPQAEIQRSNLKAAVGVRSARNRRENYDVNDLYILDKRKSHNSGKKPSWLMLAEHEECYRYIPQLGDEVAYLRQGHEEYLGAVHSNESGPWEIFEQLRAVEFCKVEEMKYSTFPGSGESCCKLTLVFTDPSSCGYGKGFHLTLPELSSIPDFLVERTRYDSSIQRSWTYRDKCLVWWRNEIGEGGSWWEGRILSVKPKSQSFPESPWENMIIQYKNDSSGQHSHSPWELHDAGTQWEHPCIDDMAKKKFLAAILKIEKTSQRNKDKYGFQSLNQVSQKSEYLNRFPVPLSLELIRRRLENDYYRTVEAVKHDFTVMLSNAQSYFSSAKMRKLADMISDAIAL